MLDVAYEAVGDLTPGELAAIDEDRGRIRVRLDEAAPLADVVRRLNSEVGKIMASVRWFQLWEDEVLSHNTPGRPLQVEYLLQQKAPLGVYVEERRGLLSFFIDPDIDVPRFAAVMNPVIQEHLAGGQWFQMYAGEIIDNSPEPMSQV